MKKITLLAAFTVMLLTVACSNTSENQKAVVTGSITVADTVDSSGDFSGIGVTIVKRDSSNAPIDTLFSATTDESGKFEGVATFPGKNYYPLIISRNDTDIASFNVILADNDSLLINAQLPNIRETLALDSREHEAMNTLNRVDRNFQRVSAFILGGAVPDSQIVDETKKWSELYWQVYEGHENTMAAYLAAEQSAELLSNWDPEAMLARIDEALPADYMFSVALKLGKPYIAQNEGFDAASGYLDSLMQISENEEVSEFIARDKIQMYFDSSRIGEAKDLLDVYEQDYSNSPSSKKWIRRIRYDLNYLAPGVTAPDFSFVTMEGDTVNNQRLKGSTYIIEISPLANFEYQNDYDRTMSSVRSIRITD